MYDVRVGDVVRYNFLGLSWEQGRTVTRVDDQYFWIRMASGLEMNFCLSALGQFECQNRGPKVKRSSGFASFVKRVENVSD